MAEITRGAFAKRLCNSFGLKVSLNRKLAIVSWETAEGTPARFNPLATTKAMPGDSHYNTTGVRNYPTLKIGVEATRSTLSEHRGQNYEPIVAALKANAEPEVILRAVAASAWGTGWLALQVLPWARENFAAYAAKPIGQ